MNFSKTKDIISKSIFGEKQTLTLEKNIFLILTFFSSVIVLVGDIVNVIFDLNIFLTVVTTISLLVVLLFYLVGRFSHNYENYVVPLFIVSIFLFAVVWVLNAGFNGNTINLMFVYFLGTYVVVKPPLRFAVFAGFLITFSSLIILQYKFPELIIPYDNMEQRIADLLFGNALYFVMFYLIIDIIIKSYSSENHKVHIVNEDLKIKNLEIENTNIKLRESEKQYRALLEVSLDGIHILDENGNLLGANNSFLERLGYTAQESQQLQVSDWDSRFKKDDLLYMVHELLKEGRTFESIHKTKNGEEFPVEVSASGATIDGKRILFCAARDVSERKKADKGLTDQRNLLETIINILPDRIYVKDADARFILNNKAHLAALGASSQDQVLGKTDFDFRSKEIAQILYNEDLEVIRNQKKVINKEQYIILDDKGSWLLVSKLPFINSEGKVIGLVGISRDIMELKNTEEALREREEQFRLLITTMHQGLALHEIITDDDSNPIDYRFIDINESYERITGLKRTEVIGKRVLEVIPNLEPHWIDIYGQVALSGKPAHFEDYVESLDKYFDVVAYQPQPKHFAVIVSDITERKKMDNALLQNEKQLRELTEELEDKVRSRTEQLEESNQQLESFSYSVSHDLRAPIRAIDSFSKILLEEEETKLSADGKRTLTIIRKNTQRMGHMIDDLLQFSRTSRAEIKKVHFDMEPFVIKLFEESLKLEQLRAVKSSIVSLPKAFGDPSLLRQVWINLIGNAIKFTRLKDLAEITIGGSYKNDSVEYWIKDNGTGFDMKYADKLFGVFQRLHTQQEFEGTGVGLAIVHRIIQRHGGKIWVESEVNKGTTFYFYLPNEELATELLEETKG